MYKTSKKTQQEQIKLKTNRKKSDMGMKISHEVNQKKYVRKRKKQGKLMKSQRVKRKGHE